MLTSNEIHPELAKNLGVKSLYFKREDQHPYGSHKGRSIPVMINYYMASGTDHFAISSSGNAALAAALYISEINKKQDKKIYLDILVGQNIRTSKLEKLEGFKNEYVSVTMHDRPLQTLFRMTDGTNVVPLRQSNDDIALLGYHKLGEELLEIPDLRAVFIGTSSGTTAQALAEYIAKSGKRIEIHIVQTSSCHPIASSFVDDDFLNEKSIADAIVDQTAIRKVKLIKAIEDSGGSGWIASNEQIKSAMEMSEKYAKTVISTNSALSVAGLMQAVYTGKSWDGSVVCMICGD